MRDHLVRTAIALTLLGAVACAPEGEPVALDDAPLAQAAGIAPVLIFHTGVGRSSEALHIQPATVSGAFPASFRLTRALAPPSREVLDADSIRTDVTRIAVASIAALPGGYPPRLPVVRRTATSTCGDAARAQPAVPNACVERTEACPADGGACARMVLRCDSHRAQCTVTDVEGDAALLLPMTQRISGLSRQFGLLYVTRDVPAQAPIAQLYAGGDALTAGYHLIEPLTPSRTQQERSDACIDEATRTALTTLGAVSGGPFVRESELVVALALAAFNQRHGTAHQGSDVLASDPRFTALLVEAQNLVDTEVTLEIVQRKCLLLAPPYAARADFDARDLSFSITGPAPVPRVGDVYATTPLRERDDLRDFF